MHLTVSTILVTENGPCLQETIHALQKQTRPHDRCLIVVNGSHPDLAQRLQQVQQLGAAPLTVFVTGKKLSFPEAVNTGAQHLQSIIPQNATTEELFWILSEDAAPDAYALEKLALEFEKAPSLAAAAPKLVEWDRPNSIVDLGQSLTRFGEKWAIGSTRLDQQQYDHLQETLGARSIGLLVRASVWHSVEGLDPAYALDDCGLDLCVRMRLAGFRIVLTPRARIRFADSVVSSVGAKASERRRHGVSRRAQIHRKLAYAHPLLMPLMWIALPLNALAHSFWCILREKPELVVTEWAAALHMFFRLPAILRSRRKVAAAIQQYKSGQPSGSCWAQLRPLRIDSKTVRDERFIDRETLLISRGRKRPELHFITTGGLPVLLISIILSVLLTWWLYLEDTLSGGHLIPLNDLLQLWRNTETLNGVPADPFTWILALLGSLTPFQPSFALLLFFAFSIPLATLSAWVWGAQFTTSAFGRALVALSWALSPVVLGSIDHGRISTLVLAIILPITLIAVTRAHHSWNIAVAASILVTVCLACAPVLIPAAIILWMIGLIVRRRTFSRIFIILIVPFVVFFPKILYCLSGTGGNTILDLLREPGVIDPHEPATVQHLLLGFPEFGLEGWKSILQNFGLDFGPATLFVGFLFLPIAILALVGLFTARKRVSVTASLVGGLGMCSAIFASHLALVAEGNQPIYVWTGSPITLYWLALLTLAAAGVSAIGKSGAVVGISATVAAAIGVAPLMAHMMLGLSEVRESSSRLPSIVLAAGAQNPQMKTLVLTAAGTQKVRAEIISGVGRHLDDIRSAQYSSVVSANDQQIGELIASLTSLGAVSLVQELHENNIEYVLLRENGDSTERGKLQSVLDQQGALEGSGKTNVGTLWKVRGRAANAGGGL